MTATTMTVSDPIIQCFLLDFFLAFSSSRAFFVFKSIPSSLFPDRFLFSIDAPIKYHSFIAEYYLQQKELYLKYSILSCFILIAEKNLQFGPYLKNNVEKPEKRLFSRVFLK